MRPTALRHLNVLAGAGVVATAAILSASISPVLANSDAPPAPYIVAIDPGHGGTADDSKPEQLFDPGVTASNGLLEKDLTLAVAKNLRTLLENDKVKVIMTRDNDRFVGIATRESAANDARADLFVSIHFNYFTDPSVGGSLVLYPNTQGQGFAGVMASALESKLKPLGIGSNGTMMKPDLWTHATMPTVTVEAAYLTNPGEAGLMTQASALNSIAGAVDTGILTQAPVITQRKADILAYQKAHAQAPAATAVKAATSFPRVPLAVAAALVAGAVVFRRRIGPIALPALAAVIAVVTVVAQRGSRKPEWRNRRGVRRRRSRARPWPVKRAA